MKAYSAVSEQDTSSMWTFEKVMLDQERCACISMSARSWCRKNLELHMEPCAACILACCQNKRCLYKNWSACIRNAANADSPTVDLHKERKCVQWTGLSQLCGVLASYVPSNDSPDALPSQSRWCQYCSSKHCPDSGKLAKLKITRSCSALPRTASCNNI